MAYVTEHYRAPFKSIMKAYMSDYFVSFLIHLILTESAALII